MARLVVDASFIIAASVDAAGLGPLRDHELVAPPIMESEAGSGLHEMSYRGEISASLAEAALERATQLPVTVIRHLDLWPRAWHIADQLGWAKTYDAEYVALAQLLDCPLVTIDLRLARGAARIAQIVGPGDVRDL